MTRLRKWLRQAAAAAAAALLVAAVAAAGLIAANPPAALAARAIAEAAAALGRPMHAERAEATLWPAPVVVLDDVISARAPGAARPGLITARRVELGLALWPLVAGEVRLARVRIDQPRLTADGDLGTLASWRLDGGAAGPEVSIVDGAGTLGAAIGGHRLTVALEGVRARWPGSGPVVLEAAGQIGDAAPFSLSGLWWPTAGGQRLEIAEGGLGAGRMSGTLTLAPGCDRPQLTAALALGALDLDGVYRHLAALDWGLDTDQGSSDRPRRLLSDRPLAFGALRALDLDLALTAETARLGEVETGTARFDMKLSDGVLEIVRANARLGDGGIDFRARVDWVERQYRLDLAAKDVPARAIGLANPLSRSQGDVSLALDLEASGRTAHEVASSLTGTVALALADGWLAADASEMVAAVFPGTRDRLGLVIEGAEARATIERGMIEAGAAVVRTPEVELALAGMIDLASESLYLDLVPVGRGDGAAGDLVPLILAGPVAQPALLPNPVTPGSSPGAGDDSENGEE